MNTTKKTAATLTVILVGGAMLAATAAMARGPMGGEIDFATLDSDGSGAISAEEFANYKTSMIQSIDTNDDGTISIEELTAAGKARDEERQAKRIEKIMERADANEDGVLTVEELASMGGRGGDSGGIPSRMDTNGDGEIDLAEFEAAKEKRGKRGEGKGPKGEDGDHSHGSDE